MSILIVVVFILGYTAIALEHPLRMNKAAPALLTGMLVWTLVMVLDVGGHGAGGVEAKVGSLFHHLGEIASILFFLLGAMTVVELMDAHGGFEVITDRIRSRNRLVLLWVVGFITFFLSAALDNLTTAIVMAALLRKLVGDKNDLWTFGGVVIISANAGGAWSPIGDVTTIMLWIGGQVTTWNIIKMLIIPSLVCLILPLAWLSFSMRGLVRRPAPDHEDDNVNLISKRQKYMVFALGVMTLLGVPVFKGYTHLPPFMGIMFGLSILWIYTEFIHTRGMEARGQYQVTAILQRVDHSSILFFLGILIAVGGLQTSGYLEMLAGWLGANLPNVYAVNGALGVLSAIVDNVPLVAAAQGMYPMTTYPPDHIFWELLALCAGTGGSMLIIGSAAGVAVMGVLGIEFMWYVKRMFVPAAIGYVGAMLTYWLLV
ncbi:MAG: sodium:proton antiporter NhaD [Flavobacteriales bacterium]|nr:sodium:proton antiporter NhaD [Flavobacteriales bacterium]MCC6936757.1 sodium:proton antiporter NhaD [Flavobacteriales bacterium]